MSSQVTVTIRPPCGISSCRVPARYDCRTWTGQWANLCETHWPDYRASDQLGTGHGQRLVTADEV